MNLSGFFLVSVISCSFGWKIDVEPFEKIPMYSSQNLSFKLQMERGINKFSPLQGVPKKITPCFGGL